ncbi:FAD-binding and (Fe-S)-binding domain-containing protein [Luteococcus peritonei]|uniref:FAD-binding and (Fe-S)-binding domain-containing protein n=1 Tax=Luteococcus peritonei TaxID=88874 RepID=A0ABW4RV92_9ACTN
MSALDDYLAQPDARDCTDTTSLTRALYSSDGSIYRVVPQAVARPRSVEELTTVVRAALAAGLPLVPRGAGTSCAGNAVGEGLVVDVARHLHQIGTIDPEARTAVVQPGVVQQNLQLAARPHGLRFGPDPSTATRCTIGGMIGNNACGPRALGYGRSADNVVALDVITGTGELVRLGEGGSDAAPLPALRELVAANLGTIRTEFGHFSRQVSGYSLEHLLPENRFDAARFFSGTEGTLGVITSATVRLVSDAPVSRMLALGYPTMAEAADAMPAILPFSPVACEGMDRRIVDVVARQHGSAAVPELPRGDGWVFVELVGEDEAEVQARAEGLLAACGALEGWIVTDAAVVKALWKIRADGAGLAGVSLDNPAYAGWEDAAVPPERLGAYLREFDALLGEHGLQGLPYGHFGDGCVHCRIDFPLTEAGGPQRYREFVEQAAALAARHGGSMSGEHGDGRARSALLGAMYSPEAISLFGQVKQLFDPHNLLNPGVLVDPRPVEADIRVAATLASPLRTEDPDFVTAVHQCTGVGKCLADSTAGGGVMCPSFQATRDEKDSTRGRARVLQEMVNGSLVAEGWRSPEVHEALDLCLSCKGCSRDCPTGIDMPSYKSRVLHESYKGRLRPMSHYALGWLPRWGRLVTRVPGVGAVANLGTQLPGAKHLVRLAAGVDQRRPMPEFRTGGSARSDFRGLGAVEGAARPGLEQQAQAEHSDDTTPSPYAPSRLVRRVASGLTAGRTRPTPGPVSAPEGQGRPVVIWVDSFTDSFVGNQLAGLVQTLVGAGFEPRVLQEDACCGLTWITTGQLDGARRQLRAALEVLHPIVAAGIPVVGLEPSCMAVWRSDAKELLHDDERVAEVADGIHTLAELLATVEDLELPDLSGHTIIAQPHCHHAAVLGWAADAALLARTGAEVVTLGGCCGLAGNFGVERGHYEVSVKVAEHDLLPALHAKPEAIVLADGFSCRKQVKDLEARDAMTLGELLAAHRG